MNTSKSSLSPNSVVGQPSHVSAKKNNSLEQKTENLIESLSSSLTANPYFGVNEVSRLLADPTPIKKEAAFKALSSFLMANFDRGQVVFKLLSESNSPINREISGYVLRNHINQGATHFDTGKALIMSILQNNVNHEKPIKEILFDCKNLTRPPQSSIMNRIIVEILFSEEDLLQQSVFKCTKDAYNANVAGSKYLVLDLNNSILESDLTLAAKLTSDYTSMNLNNMSAVFSSVTY
jgi:hypothetical protein